MATFALSTDDFHPHGASEDPENLASFLSEVMMPILADMCFYHGV